MNIAAINRTIGVLCEDLNAQSHGMQVWQFYTEEELLFEACVCIFSSQMRFEVSEAAASRLMELRLLGALRLKGNKEEYEEKLRQALAEPLKVELDGEKRHVRPRFRNRMASLLATTVKSMQAQNSSLRTILFSASSARDARAKLVSQVWGFGPKQASLFLRRVGYSVNLAVLDTHILDYLNVARGINPKRNTLGRLSTYEMIEEEFQRVADEFGYPIGCVDLAMWVTMRVAKREAIW